MEVDDINENSRIATSQEGSSTNNGNNDHLIKQLIEKLNSYDYTINQRNAIRELIDKTGVTTDNRYVDYKLLVALLRDGKTSLAKIYVSFDFRISCPIKVPNAKTPLYYCVENRDEVLTKDFLTKGASIFETVSDELSPLALAIKTSQVKLIERMLAKYNVRSTVCRSGNEEIDVFYYYLACIKNKCALVSRCLEDGSVTLVNGFDLDSSKNVFKTTPLHVALLFRSYDVVKVLLRHNASVRIEDMDKRTVLHLAAEMMFSNKFKLTKDFYDIADTILELASKLQDNPADSHGFTHFHFACTRNSPEIVERFLVGQNLNLGELKAPTLYQVRNFSPVHLAVSCDCPEIIPTLIKHGAKVDEVSYQNLTPLLLAVTKKKQRAVQILLENGAVVSNKYHLGQSPIHRVYYKDNKNNELMMLLLKYGVDSPNQCNSSGLTHFHVACTRNDPAIVESYLKNGAALDSRVKNDKSPHRGFTPLHFACEFIRRPAVELLLKNGANVAALNQINVTPLHAACSMSYSKFFEPIDDYELECDSEDMAGDVDWTKNREDHVGTIELLLKEKTADVNCTDAWAKTPLIYACDALQYSTFPKKATKRKLDSRLFAREVNQRLLKEIFSRRKLVIEALIKAGASLSFRSVLHCVVSRQLVEEDVDLLNFLIDKGAEVDKGLTTINRTPLQEVIHQACHRSDTTGRVSNDYSVRRRVAELLLLKGAKATAKDLSGRTAVFYLTNVTNFEYDGEKKFVAEILDLLLDNDCDVDCKVPFGGTALHRAVRLRNDCVVELLLSRGADVNALDFESKSVATFLQPVAITTDTTFDAAFVRTFKVLHKHVIKMKAMGMTVDKRIRTDLKKIRETLLASNRYFKLNFQTQMEAHRKACEEEVERMNRIAIDSNTSLCTFMRMKLAVAARYARNGLLESAVNSQCFKEYHHAVKNKLKRAVCRSLVLEKAKETLCFLRTKLPELCFDKVFEYLDDEELEVLAAATEDEQLEVTAESKGEQLEVTAESKGEQLAVTTGSEGEQLAVTTGSEG